MPEETLHIAWLGAGPTSRQTGGVPGVASELLHGLARRGHRIDCFFPGTGHPMPERLTDLENLTFIWGTNQWRWNRWYSRTRIGVFVTGLYFRAVASLRLRQKVSERHRQDPFDVIYQFSNIEALAMPASLRSEVPLVIHPETHVGGELRFLISERRLALRCQPRRTLAVAASTMAVRALIQRMRIKSASLLICISAVFRDHLISDYGFPREHTIVIPNPVQLERFKDDAADRAPASPPVVLVLGRIAVRKGIEDVIAVATLLLERGIEVRIRVVGGPSLWSDYTRLLDDLPTENAEYAGQVPPAEVPGELAAADILLQASKYEPFALTVAEALAAGVPVVATSEVGASEGTDPSVVSVLEPGDIQGMADAIADLAQRLQAAPGELRGRARSEAERLFSSELVCERISAALIALVRGSQVM
ncbi:MAG TPA: glycosyltransferase family 4 protein [Solirubrobacteraceae bacterium]|jgi:glycosyltransferase involved in cell wall biosynthesis|nr:glycosyltransferase family 4 protein [Solirubrobacteraceae bacterium]